MIKFATRDLDKHSFDNWIVHMYYSNFKNIVVDAHSVASFDCVAELARNDRAGRVLIQNRIFKSKMVGPVMFSSVIVFLQNQTV
jgi:hypothetical protein